MGEADEGERAAVFPADAADAEREVDREARPTRIATAARGRRVRAVTGAAGPWWWRSESEGSAAA